MYSESVDEWMARPPSIGSSAVVGEDASVRSVPLLLSATVLNGCVITNDVFPYSRKHGQIVNKNVQKSERIPNHQRLPDKDPNDFRMSIISAKYSGKQVNVKLGAWTCRGESSLLVNRIMNISMGRKTIDEEDAELIELRRCSFSDWGDLIRIAANIIAYMMITMAKHSNIQVGKNTTTQDQLRCSSSLSATKTNCNMLTAAKNSNSIPRPFFTDQMQIDMEIRHKNISGTNTSVQVFLLVSSLSQANISNISSSN